VIFEIMGLADIMRGASQASETLGAQEIKQAWGGLRLKRTQKEVQRYARDLFRMMLEIAATKFTEETWAKMTGLPYLTAAQVAETVALMQALQQQMQTQPQPQPQQGQEAQPNQLQQQLQKAQQQLQTPKWADVLAMLRDDMMRAYRIDIETNSTVEPEAVEDQKNIAEVMNALGQFLNGVSPLVQQGVMPFQGAQAMMLAIVRRFRFGDEIEEYIKQMQAPKPPDDGKAAAEQAKAQMEQQKQAAEEKRAQEQHANAMQMKRFDVRIAERKAQLAEEQMAREAERAALEHAAFMEEMAAKRQLNAVVTASKIRIAEVTARAKEAAASQPAP
jgi:hypothetical protein